MSERIALVGGWLQGPDGVTGPVGTVLLESGLIADVGSDRTPDGARVIDCAGHTVLPGLIDAHCHLCLAGSDAIPSGVADITARAIRNLHALLASGVTSARDLGGAATVMPALRRAVERGWLDGPALDVANQLICATGGHGTEAGVPSFACEADGPAAVRHAVREQIKAGASLIKVTLNGATNRVELTEPELTALVDEAHRHGLRVACHASVRDAVVAALEAGVDTIEHGNGIDLELARRMAAAGTVLVPTASIFRFMHQAVRSGQLPGFPDHMLDALLAATQQRVLDHEATFTAALKAAVTLAAGTDLIQGRPADGIVDELEALVGSGLTAAEALRAATVGGAAALGVTDRGVIAEGLRADLLVVPGRPDTDLGVLRTPRWVIAGGRIHHGADDGEDAGIAAAVNRARSRR